jgi:hypothetical protein
MSANTAQKLQHELNSLQGLSIINIVAAAMALAFGAYFAMPTLITIATTMTLEISQVGLVVLGLIAFVAGIRWLVSCAEMIDAGSTISESLKEHKEKGTLDWQWQQPALLSPIFSPNTAQSGIGGLMGQQKPKPNLNDNLGKPNEADTLRDFLGNPHVLQATQIIHKHHQPLQFKLQNWANPP